MTFPELSTFDTGSIKRGDEALKIEFVAINANRIPPYATPGEFLADTLQRLIEELVAKHFKSTWLHRISEVLPSATDQQIAAVAADLDIDLDIPVPADKVK